MRLSAVDIIRDLLGGSDVCHIIWNGQRFSIPVKPWTRTTVSVPNLGSAEFLSAKGRSYPLIQEVGGWMSELGKQEVVIARRDPAVLRPTIIAREPLEETP